MSIWEQKPLSELCTIEIGGTPTRNNPIYWDSENTGSNYWVSIADLKKREITETAERITNLGIRHSNAKLCKKGTVLMSFKLTVGRVAIAGRDLYTNEAIAAFTSKNLDHEYLYYGLQHWNLLKNVDQAIKGITLNKSKLKKIEAHYPVDKKEQSKIAEVLSTIDRAITQPEALIAKHQRIKTGLLQDLLTRGIDEHGQLRDESTHKFKSTPLGMIPVEWEVKPVSSLAGVEYGISSPLNRELSSGVPIISLPNVNIPGDLSLENLPFVDPKLVSESDILQDGDILFNWRNGSIEHLGKTAYFNLQGTYTHVGFLLRIRSYTDVVVPKYLLYFLRSIHEEGFFKTSRIQVNNTFNSTELKALLVKLPKDIKEQQRISEVIGKESENIDKIKMSLEKLQKLKTGLMQDLLSGEVSVTPLMEK